MRSSAILLLALAAASGCGYTSGYRMPEGVYSLAVPIFDNRTFPLRREVEYELTRAVRQELELRTDVRLVERDRADSVLEGTVLAIREQVLSEGAQDVVQESSVEVAVRVRLVNAATGAELYSETIHDQAAFSIAAGETIEDARAEAIQEIAERIVARLEPW